MVKARGSIFVLFSISSYAKWHILSILSSKLLMITLYKVTALSRIQFIGQTMSQTNMSEFKRVAGKVGEGE